MSQAWKNAEREVAKILGGKRRVRVDWSESCEDVHHTVFAIEVKWGKQIPKFVRQAPLVLFEHARFPSKSIILFPLRRLSSVSLRECKRKKTRKISTFIMRGLDQARYYAQGSARLPILCMKPKGYRGVIGCMSLEDLLEARGRVTQNGAC